MSIDIFIKSYQPDFKWLCHSFESLKKNVTGYNEIILMLPSQSVKEFDYSKLPLRTRVISVNEYGSGYLFQQWCKMSAYKYSNADYIMFSDSDIIFDHAIDLQSFIPNPEILYTDYSKVGDAICWKKPTEDFIKQPMQWELMRRNNLIYHASTLKAIAEYEPNLEHIIMNSERFSEFNAIGAFAFVYEQDKYNFVNTDNWQYTEPKGKQYHSYTEFDKMISELK